METKLEDEHSNHPLQSKGWGEFRRAWGNEILWTDHGLLTLHRIPFTKYKIGMFVKCPTPTQKMLHDLMKLAKEKNLIFIKLEPNVGWKLQITNYKLQINDQLTKDKFINLLRKNGCIEGKTLFTPTTFWIDLTKSEEELMKSFSSKTRYNIRVAQRKGVEVVEDPTLPRLRGANNLDEAFEKYLELTFETTKRQGFYAHTPRYHELMWRFLHSEPITHNLQPIAHLLVAKYRGEIITTWILFTYKGFLYYPYGASTDKYKEVMANNLMMWEAIRFGKKLGLSTFDLWGREPGKGFTKFKEGYGPGVVEFLGSWDLVINKPMYRIYKLAENIRWKILRFRKKLSLSIIQ